MTGEGRRNFITPSRFANVGITQDLLSTINRPHTECLSTIDL